MSMSIAAELQNMVYEAAGSIEPGESIKAQINRAWVNLGRPAFWRVRRAWYGNGGNWTATALEDFRARHKVWKARQKARGCEQRDVALARLVALRGALADSDPHFHRAIIAVLDDTIRDMGNQTERMGAQVGAITVRED